MGIVDHISPEPVGNLEISEWDYRFETLCRNRLIMGAIRYGRMGALDKPQWDRIPDMIRRLKEYSRTHNEELLVDVSNLCQLEFVEGKHVDKHFKSVDDGQHTKRKV